MCVCAGSVELDRKVAQLKSERARHRQVTDRAKKQRQMDQREIRHLRQELDQARVRREANESDCARHKAQELHKIDRGRRALQRQTQLLASLPDKKERRVTDQLRGLWSLLA